MVITEHSFDKCSRLLLLLRARSSAHLLKSLQFRHKAREQGMDNEKKGEVGERERKGFIGKKLNQSGAQSQTSHVCTHALLPSNLRQKWERTGRDEEKQIRWRLLETSAAALISLRLSLSHFVWDNVDKKLWMQSSHVVWVATARCWFDRVDSLCWFPWPLFHCVYGFILTRSAIKSNLKKKSTNEPGTPNIHPNLQGKLWVLSVPALQRGFIHILTRCRTMKAN